MGRSRKLAVTGTATHSLARDNERDASQKALAYAPGRRAKQDNLHNLHDGGARHTMV